MFESKEQAINKLKELLDRDIPRMDINKLIEIASSDLSEREFKQASKEEIDECNKYLADFCEYGYNDGKDIFTDERCTFEWGMEHGMMYTRDNGMSRKYYHYLTLCGRKVKFTLLLQYHPSIYSIEEER